MGASHLRLIHQRQKLMARFQTTGEKIDILSSSARTANTTRYFRVVLDKLLTIAPQVTTLYQCKYDRLLYLIINGNSTDNGSRFQFDDLLFITTEILLRFG
jgi:hypothetical protein